MSSLPVAPDHSTPAAPDVSSCPSEPPSPTAAEPCDIDMNVCHCHIGCVINSHQHGHLLWSGHDFIHQPRPRFDSPAACSPNDYKGPDDNEGPDGPDDNKGPDDNTGNERKPPDDNKSGPKRPYVRRAAAAPATPADASQTAAPSAAPADAQPLLWSETQRSCDRA